MTPLDEREIVIIRSFDAPRQLVYDAYTTPELLRRWLGPRTWELTECEIDLRDGGAWRYVMHGPEGAEMVMRGVYREIVAPRADRHHRVVRRRLDRRRDAEHDGVRRGRRRHDGHHDRPATPRPRPATVRSASGMEHGMAEGFSRLDDVLAEGTRS